MSNSKEIQLILNIKLVSQTDNKGLPNMLTAKEINRLTKNQCHSLAKLNPFEMPKSLLKSVSGIRGLAFDIYSNPMQTTGNLAAKHIKQNNKHDHKIKFKLARNGWQLIKAPLDGINKDHYWLFIQIQPTMEAANDPVFEG